MKQRILFVDDEPANLRMLERLFRNDYEPITAESGAEALELLIRHDIAMIVSDQRMPEMTGITFLKEAAKLRQQTVRIILTGYTDVSDLVEAINAGVIYKYVTKPWVNADLVQTIQRGMEHYETAKRQHLLAHDNQRLQIRIETTEQVVVNIFREMIVQKHAGLGEHCSRTADYAAQIGERMGIRAAGIGSLITAALLHEFPCIRIPFSLDLNKDALTTEQFRLTRDRFENSLQMISDVPGLNDAAAIIRYQHEHFDGTGFFDGRDGEEIPLTSRILSVASAFDRQFGQPNIALAYKENDARQWLFSRSGIQFDPRMIDAFQSIEIMAAKRSGTVTNGLRPVVTEAAVGR